MNNNPIRIGDKIRFLNEVGGGIVRRIMAGIAYVEDSDGFEIPMPVSECVSISDGDTFMPAVKLPHAKAASVEKVAETKSATEEKLVRSSKELRTVRATLSDRVNVLLAVLPMNYSKIGTDPYEIYLINDSNFRLSFSFIGEVDGHWRLHAAGEIEANTKIFLEEFSAAEINEFEQVAMQLFAYKQTSGFARKPAADIDFSIDGIKLLKRHSFTENNFFEEDALLLPLISDDKPLRSLLVDPVALRKSLQGEKFTDRATRPARTKVQPTKAQPLEVDLHAVALLDNTLGMTPGDILAYQLDTFRRIMAEHAKEKGYRIVFIHGKGEGVLRKALETELRTKYKHSDFQDASFREYGFGATMVTIH